MFYEILNISQQFLSLSFNNIGFIPAVISHVLSPPHPAHTSINVYLVSFIIIYLSDKFI